MLVFEAYFCPRLTAIFFGSSKWTGCWSQTRARRSMPTLTSTVKIGKVVVTGGIKSQSKASQHGAAGSTFCSPTWAGRGCSCRPEAIPVSWCIDRRGIRSPNPHHREFDVLRAGTDKSGQWFLWIYYYYVLQEAMLALSSWWKVEAELFMQWTYFATFRKTSHGGINCAHQMRRQCNQFNQYMLSACIASFPWQVPRD